MKRDGVAPMQIVYPPLAWCAKIPIPVAPMNRDLGPRGRDFRFASPILVGEGLG
jgi:hypothetical protein